MIHINFGIIYLICQYYSYLVNGRKADEFVNIISQKIYIIFNIDVLDNSIFVFNMIYLY